MYYCERCGSSFHPRRAAALWDCPRCLTSEGRAVPLSFRLFTPLSRGDAKAVAQAMQAKSALEPVLGPGRAR
jgi:ribosomal protein L37AE/L43A